MKVLEIFKNHIEDLNYMVALFDEYAMIKTRDETKKSIIELTGAIKELENIEKEKFVDKFTYTSCEDCVNKDKDVYLEVCGNCRHFYGCSFEKKEVL